MIPPISVLIIIIIMPSSSLARAAQPPSSEAVAATHILARTRDGTAIVDKAFVTCVILLTGYTIMRVFQMIRRQARDTGMDTENHASQLGGCPPIDMRSIANMFWGDAMGDVIPPTLEASAMPMTRALLNGSSGDIVLRIGCTML